MSKQLAQAFGKRTLDRCRRFEESGHSCFSSDPALRDTLFAPLQHPESKQPDGTSLLLLIMLPTSSRMDGKLSVELILGLGTGLFGSA